MTSASRLLPPNAGPFELALADAMSDHLPVPLAQALDPMQTPADLLPWLAVHEGVQLWWSDWPEERKRRLIAQWPRLAWLIGTRAAAEPFLAFVDATIVHKVAHPARYPVGRMAAGIQPVNHKPFVARYLLKVALRAPARAICVGRTAVGRSALRTINREPLRRAMTAISTAKGPAPAYTVTFAHRLPTTLDQGLPLDEAGSVLGQYQDRIRL